MRRDDDDAPPPCPYCGGTGVHHYEWGWGPKLAIRCAWCNPDLDKNRRHSIWHNWWAEKTKLTNAREMSG